MRRAAAPGDASENETLKAIFGQPVVLIAMALGGIWSLSTFGGGLFTQAAQPVTFTHAGPACFVHNDAFGYLPGTEPIDPRRLAYRQKQAYRATVGLISALNSCPAGNCYGKNVDRLHRSLRSYFQKRNFHLHRADFESGDAGLTTMIRVYEDQRSFEIRRALRERIQSADLRADQMRPDVVRTLALFLATSDREYVPCRRRDGSVYHRSDS
jgi:hypothetical protein